MTLLPSLTITIVGCCLLLLIAFPLSSDACHSTVSVNTPTPTPTPTGTTTPSGTTTATGSTTASGSTTTGTGTTTSNTGTATTSTGTGTTTSHTGTATTPSGTTTTQGPCDITTSTSTTQAPCDITTTTIHTTTKKHKKHCKNIVGKPSYPDVPTSPDECGEYVYKATSGEIFSPGYPFASGYYNKIEYLISCPKSYQFVELQFASFDLQYCSQNCDKLYLYDGPNKYAPAVHGTNAGLTYRLISYVYRSTSRYMLLKYITDGSVRSAGWSASYKCIDSDDYTALASVKPTNPHICPRQTTYYEPGTINAPGFPGGYGICLNCTYELICPSNDLVELRFTRFATQKCCDAVWLRYDNCPALKLSGRLASYVYRSGLNSLNLTFTTDGGSNRLAWSFEWDCIRPSKQHHDSSSSDASYQNSRSRHQYNEYRSLL